MTIIIISCLDHYLLNAVELGQISSIQECLKPESPAIPPHYLRRALCKASAQGNIQVVEMLLKAGATVCQV